MDNLSLSIIDRNPQTANISGYILIKRKMFWAERYARIKDRKLSYYEDKTDTVPRAILSLASATLVENVNGRADLFELKLKSGPIASLFIKIDSKTFRTKFITCLKDNIRAPQGPVEQEPSCDLDEAGDVLAKLPDLPSTYQYVFQDKYTIERVTNNHVIYERYHKRPKGHNRVSNILSKPMTVWHTVFLALLIYAVSLYRQAFLSLSALFLLYTFISLFQTNTKHTKVKEQIMLQQNILDILHALRHKRQELYQDKNNQIEFHQAQFKDDNRVFLVETTMDNKLKYLWEICGFGNETVVAVFYDTHSPQIHINMLSMLVGRCRIDEALKGLSEPSKQLNRLLSSKEDKVLGRMDTTSKNDTMTPKGSSIEVEKQYLPPLDQLVKIYPDVPKDVLSDLVVSRERYLSHLTSKWDSMETKNNCNMYVKDIDGNLATKGQTTIKANLEAVMEYILDIEKRPEYDQMYNCGKIITDYGAMGIVYQKFNGIFPVKARDFVILLSKQKIQKGFLIHVKSINFDYPLDPKSVRAIVVSGGFELKQVEPGMVRVTYITETNLCGDLPNIVRRTAGKMQSGVIMKFREVALKRFT